MTLFYLKYGYLIRVNEEEKHKMEEYWAWRWSEDDFFARSQENKKNKKIFIKAHIWKAIPYIPREKKNSLTHSHAQKRKKKGRKKSSQVRMRRKYFFFAFHPFSN